MEWHWGPTERDADPQSMWHSGCGGRVTLFDGALVCAKCGLTAEPDDIGEAAQLQASEADRIPPELLIEDGDEIPEGYELAEQQEGAGLYRWAPAAPVEFYDRMHRRYDWVTIENRYVLGYRNEDGGQVWPSLEEVASFFGASYGRVREKSASMGWVSKRQQFQDELRMRAAEEKAKKFTDATDRLDNKALMGAELGVTLVTMRLSEIAEQRKLSRERGENAVGISRIDARELESLARAADMFHRLGLRACGDVEAMRMEITGANGQPIQITSELTRDNPERLAGVLEVLDRAGFGEVLPRLVAQQGGEPRGPAAIEAGS